MAAAVPPRAIRRTRLAAAAAVIRRSPILWAFPEPSRFKSAAVVRVPARQAHPAWPVAILGSTARHSPHPRLVLRAEPLVRPATVALASVAAVASRSAIPAASVPRKTRAATAARTLVAILRLVLAAAAAAAPTVMARPVVRQMPIQPASTAVAAAAVLAVVPQHRACQAIPAAVAGQISLRRRLAARGRHRPDHLGRMALVTPMERVAEAAGPERRLAPIRPAVVAASGRNGIRLTDLAAGAGAGAALRLGTPTKAVSVVMAAIMAAAVQVAAGMALPRVSEAMAGTASSSSPIRPQSAPR